MGFCCMGTDGIGEIVVTDIDIDKELDEIFELMIPGDTREEPYLSAIAELKILLDQYALEAVQGASEKPQLRDVAGGKQVVTLNEVATMRIEPHSCMCKLCAQYQINKFAEIMSCGCYCHSHGYTGHTQLCCSLPNVLPEDHIEANDLAGSDPNTKNGSSNPPKRGV